MANESIAKDGWHVVCGFDVYIRNGYIIRGVADRGRKTIYPYRRHKYGEWSLDQFMTPSAFRSAYKRGTVRLA